MAQKIIVESAESANNRLGCGCLVFLIALLIGVPALCGHWIAGFVDNDAVSGVLVWVDQKVPWWTSFILLFGGWFFVQAQVDN